MISHNNRFAKRVTLYLIPTALFLIIFQLLFGKYYLKDLTREYESKRKDEIKLNLSKFVEQKKLEYKTMVKGYAWWGEIAQAFQENDHNTIINDGYKGDKALLNNYDSFLAIDQHFEMVYGLYDGVTSVEDTLLVESKRDRKLEKKYYDLTAKKYNEMFKKYENYQDIISSLDSDNDDQTWHSFENYNGSIQILTISPICSNWGYPYCKGFLLFGNRLKSVLKQAELIIPAKLEISNTPPVEAYTYLKLGTSSNNEVYISITPNLLVEDIVKQSLKILITVEALLFIALLSILLPILAKNYSRILQGIIDEQTISLDKQNSELEAASKSKSLFLNNSGQGFLSFGVDLIVEKEYSSECDKLFGKTIDGESITTLLFPDNENERSRLKENFISILTEEREYTKKLYLSLLKKEFKINKSIVKAQYRVVDNNRMILILTDITREKELECDIAQERNYLKFVITAVQESTHFFEIIDDFESFKKDYHKLLTSTKNLDETFSTIYREIHTYKGLFAQQNFPNLPLVLHEIEDYLTTIGDSKKLEKDKLINLLERFDCDEALSSDLAIVEDNLGSEFLNQKEKQGTINISKRYAEKIESLSKKLLSCSETNLDLETCELLREAENILKVNLKSLVGFQLNNAIKFADRLGKNISLFSVDGDNIFLKPSLYSPFTKSLVHIYRNAIDHGIEAVEERESLNKGEAKLVCHIHSIKEEDSSTKFRLSISDNGRGLDLEKIKTKAIEKNILSSGEVEELSDEQLYHLIFNHNFSTKSETTLISGRGVGLSSVKDEVDKLKGEIQIESKSGEGTTFHFVIPIIN